VTRKSIATNMAVVSCDVCGRTLLRGEKADVFLHGGQRRTVCELCTARASNEGWIREGFDDPDLAANERGGRGLLARLRRRERAVPAEAPAPAPAPVAEVDPAWAEDDGYYEDEPLEPAAAPVAEEPVYYEEPAPEPAYEPEPEPAAQPVARAGGGYGGGPSNVELKLARALELFNASGHPRTVAGVSRSLGAPMVSVRPSTTAGAVVDVVVGWELSWYRYAVDAQGSELSELEPAEQQPNAEADDRGGLRLAGGLA
jgi:hypothetical protein